MILAVISGTQTLFYAVSVGVSLVYHSVPLDPLELL